MHCSRFCMAPLCTALSQNYCHSKCYRFIKQHTNSRPTVLQRLSHSCHCIFFELYAWLTTFIRLKPTPCSLGNHEWLNMMICYLLLASLLLLLLFLLLLVNCPVASHYWPFRTLLRRTHYQPLLTLVIYNSNYAVLTNINHDWLTNINHS